MGLYKYKCGHTDCEILAKGVRKCKECNMVIITDRGVDRHPDKTEIINSFIDEILKTTEVKEDW